MIADDAGWALAELARRRPRYALWRAYADGNHRLRFATERFRTTFGDLFRDFADNLCGQVIDTVADRMRIAGWSTGEGAAAADAARAWGDAMLAPIARHVHTEALTVGDAYLLVWPLPDGSGPGWYPQLAEETIAHPDPDYPRRLRFAAKAWLERDPLTLDPVRGRLTLYYPDRVERYTTPGVPRDGAQPTDPAAYVPVADAAIVPNPYGEVPVFWWANAPGPDAAGRAEHRAAIPLQDAMNKTLLDLLVGAEYQSLPQRWATGVETPVDPETGRPVPLQQGPASVWALPEPEARVGTFPAANLEQLLTVADGWALRIARATGTPAHRLLLTGERWPSGEALHVAEAPLVAKCTARADDWTPVWGQALTFALEVAGHRPDGVLRPMWHSPSSASEAARVDTLAAKQRIGWSRRELMREHGLTDDEADRVLAEAREERAADIDHGAIL